MKHFSFLFSYILVILFSIFMKSQTALNSPCVINDWRKSKGICKPLRDCGDAISNLRANVQPTLCNIAGKRAIVCCPTEPRISEKMCDQYKEVHREKIRPGPLLPLEFIPDDEAPRDIECQILKNPLIVGGRDAKTDEFPHMVGLGWGNDPNKLEWKCGGTLISEDFVLTAAHCIETAGGKPSYVLLGDIRKDLLQNKKPGSLKRIVLKIKNYIKHPAYKKPLSYNDIALVQLERKVPFSKSIVPACLPQPHHRHELKANMTTLGWGLIGTGQGSSDILQAVNLERFSADECNEIYADNPDKKYKYPHGILRTQFCAGDRGQTKDTCGGDSGGPITVHNDTIKCMYHVMGITSFGSYICGIQPGVYTNVQSYMDWIEQNVWPNEV